MESGGEVVKSNTALVLDLVRPGGVCARVCEAEAAGEYDV